MDVMPTDGIKNEVVEKWEPVLEGIGSDYGRRVTAQLLENQAKSIISEKLNEAVDTGSTQTTVGRLGTFQKFAFPIVRRVYPELIANNIVGVQPMQGPVSQIFYIGNSRVDGGNEELIYSKYNLTYKGQTTRPIFDGANYDMDHANTMGGQLNAGALGNTIPQSHGGWAPSALAGNDLTTSALFMSGTINTSATMGGDIADWPSTGARDEGGSARSGPARLMGFNVSAGERLAGSGIPEMVFHIEQQPVAARTRKMRALWTLEASQDLKAYHNLDLERELTDMLGKELRLEIDRELIEDLRMLSYDVDGELAAKGSKWNKANLDQANSNNFVLNPDMASNDAAADFLYDYTTGTDNAGTHENVFLYDFSTSALDFAPQHVGHVYANLLAMLQLMAQDIYKTTMRGPGNWIVCSPLIASMLHSAAKLEGGMERSDGPTNVGGANIEYKGKLAGQWDLYVDPMYPEDELMMGYKGANAMDSGFVYSPYIPLQTLPTIVDPTDFQPRKGILTRYGKAAVTPASRYYRILRLIGPTANFLFTPFAKVKGGMA
jgi:hypothetical protein